MLFKSFIEGERYSLLAKRLIETHCTISDHDLVFGMQHPHNGHHIRQELAIHKGRAAEIKTRQRARDLQVRIRCEIEYLCQPAESLPATSDFFEGDSLCYVQG